MKVFQVIRKYDNRAMFKMACTTLPYSIGTLESMSKNGYAFKVDGELMSLFNVIKAFSNNGEARQAAPAIAKETSDVEIRTGKEVRCIETGEIYSNQSAAAKALGIDPAQVSDSIKTGRKRSGYTFEKVIHLFIHRSDSIAPATVIAGRYRCP